MTGQEEFSGKFRRWQNSPAGEAYMKVSLLNEPSRDVVQRVLKSQRLRHGICLSSGTGSIPPSGTPGAPPRSSCRKKQCRIS